MWPKYWIPIAFACVSFLAFQAPGRAQDLEAEKSDLVVYCYDSSRDMVSRELAAECRGRVVSEKEAQEFQNRRSLAINRALHAHPYMAPEGMKITAIGTGFFIDESGKLLTNNHVIDSCHALVVEPASSSPLPAKVLAIDVARDLALISTGSRSPGIATFQAPVRPDIGSYVATVGYPDQGIPPRVPIVTAGIVEPQPQRLPPVEGLVIKADVRPGNSGGPVFDEHGLVIGVMRAKINTVKVYAEGGQFLDDIGISVPGAVVLDFLNRNAIKYQSIHD